MSNRVRLVGKKATKKFDDGDKKSGANPVKKNPHLLVNVAKPRIKIKRFLYIQVARILLYLCTARGTIDVVRRMRNAPVVYF